MLHIARKRLHKDDEKNTNVKLIESQKMHLAKPVAIYPRDPKTGKVS
jgi:hypothetical protein